MNLSFENLRWPALVTVLSIIVYQRMVIAVGTARRKYQIDAPQVTGNPEFERIFRTQQNTLEQFPGFLAGLWMFSIFINAEVGAFLGLFWVITRILFAKWYLDAPEARTKATIPGYLVVIIFHTGVAIAAFKSLLFSILQLLPNTTTTVNFMDEL